MIQARAVRSGSQPAVVGLSENPKPGSDESPDEKRPTRLRQWVNDLDLLDDRAGPPMRDDEGQRVLMFRT